MAANSVVIKLVFSNKITNPNQKKLGQYGKLK